MFSFAIFASFCSKFFEGLGLGFSGIKRRPSVECVRAGSGDVGRPAHNTGSVPGEGCGVSPRITLMAPMKTERNADFECFASFVLSVSLVLSVVKTPPMNPSPDGQRREGFLFEETGDFREGEATALNIIAGRNSIGI
jgi:hypothetical protein